eukprot:CAMPEP_0170453514 /NCGR_PEP_ID=MMETSP0123-20130129/2069_1 /TAXON_ID=182087 /ORGANISM="Favella ehrenbergii, Strain Fehren 1" /LENGTH=51 /DNA_ID=CAMNT_0010715909 /DNA_START=1077 /DNA_END=1232 /DNA_ORIENTATION=-
MATSIAMKGSDMNQTFNVNVAATSEGSPENRKQPISMKKAADSDTVSMAMI